MILLSGHSLTPARKIPVESMSLQLNERESSATVSPADMTGISTGGWVKSEKGPAAGIVWRVKSIEQNYAQNTPRIQMEHAVSILKDRILFGEVTAAKITGNPNATECSAEAAVRYILGKQSDWKLGTFGFSLSAAYKFDGDTLLDALEKVSDTLEDSWWSYDFSSYPFKLNITKQPSGVACVLRPGRNLTALSKTVDRTGMYTRFYPIGKDDLHISGDYVSRNEDLYGVVSHVEVDQSLDTETELRRWANHWLKRHAEPKVTVTVGALELADATGESMDRLTLGRICRIPLTEFGTEIEERITEISYQDTVHAPEVAQVTLANIREDVTKLIADAMKKSAGGGRGGARQQKEDHAWFEDTDTHVKMVAEGIVGTDEEGNPDWARLSELTVDGNGITSQVSVIKEGQDIMASQIKQTEKEISLAVKKGEVISEINMEPGSIRISAKKINIDGVIQNIKAVQGSITDLSSGRTNISKLWVSNIQGYSATLTGTLTYLGHTITSMNAYNRNGDNIAVLGWRQ